VCALYEEGEQKCEFPLILLLQVQKTPKSEFSDEKHSFWEFAGSDPQAEGGVQAGELGAPAK
jgi:hypothetical protein